MSYTYTGHHLRQADYHQWQPVYQPPHHPIRALDQQPSYPQDGQLHPQQHPYRARQPTCWDPPWLRQSTAYQQPSSYEPDMYSPPPPSCWDPPWLRTQHRYSPYDQPPPQYHHQDETQSPYGYGLAPTYEREPYRQPRQPTSWDLPGQPIQHGISAYDWQPQTDWPPPPLPTYEPDPYFQPHSAPQEHLNYFGRSSHVQQQGSAEEYHSWLHQQLPPQPVLDQPQPQQRSSSGWIPTSHCSSAAPLPADVVPLSNLQHVSLASETMTNLLPNQAPVSAISTSMLSSCFPSFAPVSVRDEAGTNSLTNKSVVLGRAAVPEQTISQSKPSIASAPQSLQKAHKDVEVVKMLSKTMAGDFDFKITN